MTGSGKTSVSNWIGWSTEDKCHGRDLLETDRRDDVAGADGVEVLAVVGVHQKQASETLLFMPLVV